MNVYKVNHPLFKDYPHFEEIVNVTCAVCNRIVTSKEQDGWYIISFDVGPEPNGMAHIRKACCSMLCADTAGLQQLDIK